MGKVRIRIWGVLVFVGWVGEDSLSRIREVVKDIGGEWVSIML